jgi:catechol 2,3-dioxygenase-like lactoylglutathione lyase family enzyme
VLFVQAIEPVLSFWRDRLGFELVAEVPHGGLLGFVILGRDDATVMYQSYASVAEDVPALAADVGRGAGLFIRVSDIDTVERALEGVPLVQPRRRTFYGMDEITVREPAGWAVTFAQQVAVA